MRAISLNLRSFIKEVYGFDYEEILSGDYFNFDTSWVTAEKDEVKKAKELIMGYTGLSERIKESAEDTDLLKVAVESVKAQNYESTYIDEYFEGFKSQIEEKIIKDIENIQKMLAEDIVSFNVSGQFTCKLDWYEDKIIFSGKIKALEAVIVEVINNYGMFQYSSIEEFKYCNEGNIKKRIENHIAWLKETENIYGTIYNLFKFDTKFIDYYGNMGRA